jgi:hypothetical protein
MSAFPWAYAVFFSISQYTSVVIIVPCCMNSTMSMPSLSQKAVIINFLADVCLEIYGLFSECVCIHCFEGFRFHHLQIKPRFQHLLLVRCNWETRCRQHGIAIKIKAKAILCILWAPVSNFEPVLSRTCDAYLTDNLVENSAYNLWKFTRHIWNCEASSFANMVDTLNKIITHYVRQRLSVCF